MKKTVISMIAGVVLLSNSVYAQAVEEPIQNSADGFYLGLGGGVSFNVSFLSVGNYQDDTAEYTTGSLSDSDAGYIVYGGYQFNKIIAVESAYTDYGSFSDSADRRSGGVETFTSDPSSLSVYANAGYTFGNGLRPFLQLGVGYLQINGSSSTKDIGLDDSLAMHFGLGLEYAPPKLAGFGFRVAYVEDVAMDMSYKSEDDGQDTSTVLTNVSGLLYIGAQYKF